MFLVESTIECNSLKHKIKSFFLYTVENSADFLHFRLNSTRKLIVLKGAFSFFLFMDSLWKFFFFWKQMDRFATKLTAIFEVFKFVEIGPPLPPICAIEPWLNRHCRWHMAMIYSEMRLFWWRTRRRRRSRRRRRRRRRSRRSRRRKKKVMW